MKVLGCSGAGVLGCLVLALAISAHTLSAQVRSDTVVGWYEGEARVSRPVVVPPGGWAEVDLAVP